MKGVFESRRHKLKYDKIWDVSVVFKHLSSLYPNEKLSLKDLMHKVLMLILLVSSQQGQSIHYLDLQHLTMEEDNYFFDVTEHIKTSTPRSPYTRTDIAAYEPDSIILSLAFVLFTAHSTRSASVSKANEKDVPVHEIMAKADWKSAEIFRKYYNKPVLQGNRLASAILDQWHLWCVFWNIAVALSLILFLLDNILKTWLSLFMFYILLWCGFNASCLTAFRMGASTL